jgi:outer membrane protein insertion porin family
LAQFRLWCIVAVMAVIACARTVVAQAPTTAPAESFVDPSLVGRTVEEVRINGNAQVSSLQIRRSINTTEGEPFDPVKVQEDYQRVYALNRFTDVQAKVEPTKNGVIVIFDVTEQKLIHSIRFIGNHHIDSDDLEKAIELNVGEAIEPFRISLAKKTIVAAYQKKNYPECHVEIDEDAKTRTGDLIFRVVEGPHVTIRNVRFVGANSFGDFELNQQISTTKWYWIFNPGTYDPDETDRDVGALQHFYRSKGFFGVKVGRKLVYSPDQSELQIDFLIDEGVRYRVERVSFVGNTHLPEVVLRKDMKMVPGKFFDADLVRLDIKKMVRDYSALGYIYDPHSRDPNYLQIGRPGNEFVVGTYFHLESGTVELVYQIVEGKPFHMGQIRIAGNDATRDNVILDRIYDAQPGMLYNSGALEDAAERLRAMPNFKSVEITPTGDGPDVRDVLISVESKQTANVSVAAQVNSNLGLGGNITYTQQNFDLFNFPTNWSDLLSDRPFSGNGEVFSATFQPGFYTSNGSVSFFNPYLFDQPYSFGAEAHYTQFSDREWGNDERHAGGSITLGKQFDKVYSASATFAAEDVFIGGIYDYFPPQRREDIINPVSHEPVIDNGQILTDLRSPRALEVLEGAGHHTVTDVGLTLLRDDTNHGPLLYQGTRTRLAFEEFGALGGEYHYHEFNASFDDYTTVFTDAKDRRTVLILHAASDYILSDAPFFERFYGGGRDSIRGFEFRGVGPRSGRELDPIGGNFDLLGSVELNFPVFKDNIRGVVFTDFGTVEPGIQIHDFRQSVGAGIRVVIPFISKAPFAFDVAFPIFKANDDIRQVFSFGVGIGL